MTVLLESECADKPGFMSGHTENFLPVLVEIADGKSNMLVDVDWSKILLPA